MATMITLSTINVFIVDFDHLGDQPGVDYDHLPPQPGVPAPECGRVVNNRVTPELKQVKNPLIART